MSQSDCGFKMVTFKCVTVKVKIKKFTGNDAKIE